MPILSVENLRIRDRKDGREIVKGLSFEVAENQCLGLVGESGSGKSLTCQAVLGVLNPALASSGRVRLNGRDILKAGEEVMRGLRGTHLGMIIQEAMSAFNPLFKIGPQMVETLRTHLAVSQDEAKEIATRALAEMQLAEPEAVMTKYPHQLSGGMLQRIMTGLTLALQPEIIIADEPTTALDSLTQKEVIQRFLALKESRRATLIFVSHDLALVRRLADQVVVLSQGEIVEQGVMKDIFNHPAQPYTRQLVEAHQSLSRKFVELMRSVEAA